MNVRSDLAMAYHMGYEDALAKRMPNATKAGVLNSYIRTNSERTETCEADETDLIPFVRADSGDFEVDYIHVMKCTECGCTYEHVNGDYEFCPRCGRKRKDVDE